MGPESVKYLKKNPGFPPSSTETRESSLWESGSIQTDDQTFDNQVLLRWILWRANASTQEEDEFIASNASLQGSSETRW